MAATILTVGILGALGALSTASLDIFYGGRETRAIELAQAMMERIRNASSYPDLLSYGDNPPAGATTPAPAYVTQNRNGWQGSIQGSGGGSLGGGAGLITITQTGTAPNRLATVTVAVDWAGRVGSAAPTLVTQVAEWP